MTPSNSQSLAPAPTALDFGALFPRAWKLFAEKPFEHIVASLLVFVLGACTLGVFIGPLLVGYVRMIDKQRRGQTITATDVFGGFDSFVSSLGAGLLMMTGIVLGCIFLVIPGLLIAAATSFTWWYIGLQRKSAIEALSASWRLFTQNFANVTVVLLLSMVINSAGNAVLFGGLVTTPFTMILLSLAFTDITGIGGARASEDSAITASQLP